MEKPRVFRICPLHTTSEIFRAEQHLDQKSFSEQIQILRREGIIIPGGWATATEEQGFSVFETIYNDTALQAQWCRENSPGLLALSGTGVDLEFAILKEQVQRFRPDVIFIFAHALILVPAEKREELRSLLNGLVLVTGYWGDELPKESYAEFSDLDYIFCSSSVYQRRFEEWAGLPAETIGNSFDDGVEYQEPVEKKYDFIFCGRTGYRLAQHLSRYAKLVKIAANSDLRIWVHEWPELKRPARSIKEKLVDAGARLPTPLLKNLHRVIARVERFTGRRSIIPAAKRACELALQAKEAAPRETPDYFMGAYWYDKKPLAQLFPGRVQPLLTNGSDYYRLLAESELVLNLHRVEDADIGNVRCFEVTGVGSCLVTDRGRELKEFFDVANDIVTFETAEECLQKVKFLLAHPDEIERIARNGQQKTLSRHLAKHRARTIADMHRKLLASRPERQSRAAGSRAIIHAIYDTEKNPISYDVAFFLQAAEIFRKITGAEDLIVSIVWPGDIVDIPGIPKSYNLAVDAHAKAFRIFHIAMQMAQLSTNKMVLQIKDRKFIEPPVNIAKGAKLITYPHPHNTHHSIYYRLVNGNPHLMEGFAATHAAHRYVSEWLRSVQAKSKVLCITLRQYAFDPIRNSDLAAWDAFLDRVDARDFTVVVVPDTDRFADVEVPFAGKYPIFTPACFDVDLRFALYEAAYLNMFVNNGPGTAATLSKRIRYVMFKLLAPGVVHCSEEVLMELGFEPGQTPKYATKFQKWVWEDDREEILWREFCAMKDEIESEAIHRQEATESAIS